MMKRCARLTAMLLALFLIPGLPARAEGFPSPEAAADAFAQALSESDLDAAIDAFGIRRRAEAYDWQAAVERVGVYAPSSSDMPAPDAYSPYASVNEAVLRGKVASQLYTLIVSFLSPDLLEGQAPVATEAGWADAFIARMDPAQLRGLRVERMVDAPGMEAATETFRQHAALHSGDEVIERIVVYALGERRFVGGLAFLRDGDAWYLLRTYSMLAGMSASGVVMEVPPASVETLLEEIAAF